MGNKTVWAKYWPAALFAVSNIAALTLVIKANSAYDAPATDAAYQASAESWVAPAADDPFDPVNSTANVDGKQPLLWDFGSDFDLDKTESSGSVGFLEAAKNRFKDLKDKAAQTVRRDQRKARERDLLSRPWNVNYYSTDGSYLGRHSISPPWGGDLPPLSPFENYSVKTGGHDLTVTSDGNRTIIVRVDPQWFKDNESMAEFLTDMTDRMIIAGIQPQVQVGRTDDSSLGVDAGRQGSRLPSAVLLPPEAKPIKIATTRIPAGQALPKPPADVMAPEPPPAFNAQLSNQLPPPPEDIRNVPAPGPLPAMPGGNATATRPNGATTTPKPAAPATPQPDAKPAAATPAPTPEPKPEAKPQPKPVAETKPEPKVRLQVQLSQIADKRRAEEAVSRLRGAGFGGSLRQTSSGLGYWVVYSRVFTSRKEANAALSKIRGMGYDAWFM